MALECPAQRGETPNIGGGIGIEFIDAYSISPNIKSIPIPIVLHKLRCAISTGGVSSTEQSAGHSKVSYASCSTVEGDGSL
jgi:hypothetical protein